MRRISPFLFFLTLCQTVGCGYQFQGSGSRLPPDVKTIYVAPVVNDTTEPGLDRRFAEELRSRFERYGVVTVVEDESAADALLSIRIKDLDERTRTVTSKTDVALDLDLVFTFAAELKKRSGEILYRDSDYQVIEPFAGAQDVVVQSSAGFVAGDIGGQNLQNLGTQELSRGQRQQAMAGILEEAARQLYEDAVAADF